MRFNIEASEQAGKVRATLKVIGIICFVAGASLCLASICLLLMLPSFNRTPSDGLVLFFTPVATLCLLAAIAAAGAAVLVCAVGLVGFQNWGRRGTIIAIGVLSGLVLLSAAGLERQSTMESSVMQFAAPLAVVVPMLLVIIYLSTKRAKAVCSQKEG